MCVTATLAACSNTTSTKAIAVSPATYDGKTVTVVGVVKDMGHGAYLVSDREGHEIYLKNVNLEGRFPPRSGETAELTGVVDFEQIVKGNMHVIQTSLEAYACDHNGNYPNEKSDWTNHFPGGTPTAGRYPVNPFSGKAYEFGTDLFFFPDTLREQGACAVCESGEDCPFTGFSAPKGIPGTIVILGHTVERGYVQEYAITGFGKQTNEPLYDLVPASGAVQTKLYWVLHN